MCHEASFPQCVLAAQSGRRPDYTVQVLEAALEAQDPLIEFAAAYDRTNSIAESVPRPPSATGLWFRRSITIR